MIRTVDSTRARARNMRIESQHPLGAWSRLAALQPRNADDVFGFKSYRLLRFNSNVGLCTTSVSYVGLCNFLLGSSVRNSQQANPFDSYRCHHAPQPLCVFQFPKDSLDAALTAKGAKTVIYPKLRNLETEFAEWLGTCHTVSRFYSSVNDMMSHRLGLIGHF